jgi:hypothetical protein
MSPTPNAATTSNRAARARPWLRRALVASVASVAIVAAARADAPVRLDGLAAVVGGHAPGPGVDTILQSDVELRARIAWSARGTADPAHDPLPDRLLAAAREELIGELLIAREARRVQAASPSAADIERERRRLVRSAGGAERLQALLAALSASADELDAIARRRALVGAFLSANLEGVTVVTDAEVERAYGEERGALEGLDRETALTELRARLAREALDRTIERWVAVLRSRTPVRVHR